MSFESDLSQSESCKDFSSQIIMKTHSLTSTLRTPVGMRSLIVMAVLLLSSRMIQAQPSASIAWSRIAGGGGTSSHGLYSLSGTIGQHEAGVPLSGGKFSVTGGFWASRVVQTPGAPLLRMFFTSSGTMVVAWPAPSSGWTLEHCSNLAMPSWSAAGGSVSVVGGENQFVIHSPMGDRFYRLARAARAGQ